MTARLPGVFISHGAPTLVLDQTPAAAFLRDLGKSLPRPRAVLCVSAHWDTAAPRLTHAAAPGTIHDFFGFPSALYDLEYRAAGDPALADRAAALLQSAGVDALLDGDRGLDHGAWVPLSLMYPLADVPVVQLSVQSRLDAAHHIALGRALSPLRSEGILVLGSGGATHNLSEFGGQAIDAEPPKYVRAFERWLCNAVEGGDEQALVGYKSTAPSARRNHPTSEHFAPLFVPMGAAAAGTRGRVLHRSFNYGILSMAAFAWD